MTGAKIGSMDGMIMILILKAGQKHLPLVYIRVKDRIPIYIGVYDNRRCGREYDLIVENCNSQRRVTNLLLGNERVGAIRFTVSITVFHYHNGTPCFHT